ncbi:MAG: response regulator transcription factor [Intestinibacter sp.]|uniref:response regulator transcription factor n=2 Tax=Intestinibacter sp. TaxID=1965304 RepID=UPI002A82A478|nr:response regulator transcription factor [Intestinibacter sp.]MDY4575688.1 response regulator transcription factor [Intestinibacter sp.]
MKNILIVEDDKLLNRGVSFALKKEGYNTISVYTKQEAKNVISENHIDFLLLDIGLPDGSGLDLCSEIKNQIDFPVVFFTANDTEEDMIRGFESGCDDYISKPFSIEVLKFKINAILKRSDIKAKKLFVYKELKIDFDSKKVYKRNEEIKLSVTEYKLLELLCKNKGIAMTKEVLLDKLWDYNGNYVDDNTLSVNVRRLRKKIEDDPKNPEYIVTLFGIGYILGE